ncbi:MAG: TagF N-terminal domain, Type secretion system-associated, partial [Labilithrix sp.]|nr:TagF N-terminal domain, Type secretion system-associated [Labilithrix sp.]
MAFLSHSTKRSSTAVALGKIPGHPEFLQVRTSREPEQSFDVWLEEGMQLAGYQYGPAWTQSFESGSVQGFVWRAPRAARADMLLCGVLFPSCDAVG